MAQQDDLGRPIVLSAPREADELDHGRTPSEERERLADDLLGPDTRESQTHPVFGGLAVPHPTTGYYVINRCHQ